MSDLLEPLLRANAEAGLADLKNARERVGHCVGQLSETQLWDRPRPEMNSVGNLMLHLAGNLRQWVVSGVGGAADHRDRQSEFDERGPIPRDELLARLDAAIAGVEATVRGVGAEELLRVRRIQGRDVDGLYAVWHAICHFRGHTQEIIHQTRAILGAAYVFAWKPGPKGEWKI